MDAERLGRYTSQLTLRYAWAGVSAAEKRASIVAAAKLGETCARTLAPHWCPLEAAQVIGWAAAAGVTVSLIPSQGDKADPRVRATYTTRPAQIDVQEWSVYQLMDEIGDKQPDLAMAMHIAHELYHHLEATGRVSPASYLRPQRWLPLSLAVLREIAAHEFVQYLLGRGLPSEWLAVSGPPHG